MGTPDAHGPRHHGEILVVITSSGSFGLIQGSGYLTVACGSVGFRDTTAMGIPTVAHSELVVGSWASAVPRAAGIMGTETLLCWAGRSLQRGPRQGHAGSPRRSDGC